MVASYGIFYMHITDQQANLPRPGSGRRPGPRPGWPTRFQTGLGVDPGLHQPGPRSDWGPTQPQAGLASARPKTGWRQPGLDLGLIPGRSRAGSANPSQDPPETQPRSEPGSVNLGFDLGWASVRSWTGLAPARTGAGSDLGSAWSWVG